MPKTSFQDYAEESQDAPVTDDSATTEIAGTPADEPAPAPDAEAAQDKVNAAAKSDSGDQTEAEEAAIVKPDEEPVAVQSVQEVQHFLVRDPDFYPDHDEIAVSFPGSGQEDAADEHGRIVLNSSDGVPVSQVAARNADGVAGVLVEAQVTEVSS